MLTAYIYNCSGAQGFAARLDFVVSRDSQKVIRRYAKTFISVLEGCDVFDTWNWNCIKGRAGSMASNGRYIDPDPAVISINMIEYWASWLSNDERAKLDKRCRLIKGIRS